jgi:hypothetical protein
MLPVTSAPAAETLPSVTVSVERVSGSQLPVLVTTLTLQSPSYGDWARAGAAAKVAAAAAKNIVQKRLERMNRGPDVCEWQRLFGSIVFKICRVAIKRKMPILSDT